MKSNPYSENEEHTQFRTRLSGLRVWLALGRLSSPCNLTLAGLGFEVLTKLLAQSVRH